MLMRLNSAVWPRLRFAMLTSKHAYSFIIPNGAVLSDIAALFRTHALFSSLEAAPGKKYFD